jgi:hypothetical protein
MQDNHAVQIMFVAAAGWGASACAGLRVALTHSVVGGLLITAAGFTVSAAVDVFCIGLAVRRSS